MSRNDTRATICPSCGKMISHNEPQCPLCGASRAGAGVADGLQKWMRGRGVTGLLFGANVVLYLVSFALSGRPNLTPSWIEFLGVRRDVAGFLGSVDPHSVWIDREYWRLLTYAFLHFNIVHIAMNMSWLVSAGPLLEREFGTFRFALVYIGSAIAGGLAIVLAQRGGYGASGAVFGMIGAGVACGMRTGGFSGAETRNYFLRNAIFGILISVMFRQHISLPGHAGGLIGGFALGWWLTPPRRRATAVLRDPPWLTVLGGIALASVPLAYVVGLAKGWFAPGAVAMAYRSGPGGVRFATWPLTRFDLAELGCPNWQIDVPRGWRSAAGNQEGAVLLSSGAGASLSILVLPTQVSLDPVKELRAYDGGGGEYVADGPDGARTTSAGARFGEQSELSWWSQSRRTGDGRTLHIRLLVSRDHDEEALYALFLRVGASARRSDAN